MKKAAKKDRPTLITESEFDRIGKLEGFGVCVPIDTVFVNTQVVRNSIGGIPLVLRVHVDDAFRRDGKRGPRRVKVTVERVTDPC